MKTYMKTLLEWEKEFPRLPDEVVRGRLYKYINTAMDAGWVVVDCSDHAHIERFIFAVLTLTDEQLRGEKPSGMMTDRWIHLLRYSGNRCIGKCKQNLWHIFHESDEDFEYMLTRLRRSNEN